MASSNQARKAKGGLSWALIEFVGQALFWIGLGIFLANRFSSSLGKLDVVIGAAGVFLGLFARKIRDYYAAE